MLLKYNALMENSNHIAYIPKEWVYDTIGAILEQSAKTSSSQIIWDSIHYLSLSLSYEVSHKDSSSPSHITFV